jgi:hypothetical protein
MVGVLEYMNTDDNDKSVSGIFKKFILGQVGTEDGPKVSDRIGCLIRDREVSFGTLESEMLLPKGEATIGVTISAPAGYSGEVNFRVYPSSEPAVAGVAPAWHTRYFSDPKVFGSVLGHEMAGIDSEADVSGQPVVLRPHALSVALGCDPFDRELRDKLGPTARWSVGMDEVTTMIGCLLGNES